MARPKQASDQEVLVAANKIYAQRGHRDFSLSELAREVGLSRAALIQRFKSADALRMRLARERVDRFSHAISSLPAGRSGNDLLWLVAFIGSMVGERRSLAAFFQNLQADLGDSELSEIETHRGEILHQAIEQRMPKTALDSQASALAFRAHLSGSMMQWQVDQSGLSLQDFLVARTRDWLRLAGISFDEKVADYPSPAN